MGNNGAFAIFAAVTQSSDRVARGRRQKRGRGLGGPPVRVHNVLNSNDSGGGGGGSAAAA